MFYMTSLIYMKFLGGEAGELGGKRPPVDETLADTRPGSHFERVDGDDK